MEDIKSRAEALLAKLDLEEKRYRIKELEAQTTNPSFWQDHQSAAQKMKELSDLQKEFEEAELLQTFVSQGKYHEAEELLERLETLLYLSGPYDEGGVIVSIHSGQGGVEAMDWAQMLFRMYARFFEKKGWSSELIEETPGEEAGIKSITLLVTGKYAYGYLKGEAGVHRLVRQSPFNADKLRQTSFALVEVLPHIKDEAQVPIKEEDLDWEFFRASSKGGQNVQKVSSAVRLRHIPTGVVVTAQSERYQGQNREHALKLLRAKLWLIAEEERKKQEKEIRGEYKTPGWGNQIRSYVLHPYHLVKDLRTGFETQNTESVLDGNLDGFIEAELRLLSA